MNYASLDEMETDLTDFSLLSFQDKLNKLKYFDFGTSVPSDEKVECNIFELLPAYKVAIDKLLELQRKVERAEKEIAAVAELAGRLSKNTSYTKSLDEIIDQFSQDAKLDEIKAEYIAASNEVQKYQGAFSLCKDADISNKYMCFVCIERSINIFLDPCGHTLCDECAGKITSRCPMCRQALVKKGRLFLSV
jgi:hypothetical protein